MSTTLWSRAKRMATWIATYAVISLVAIWVTGSVAYAAILVGLFAVIDFGAAW